MDKPFDVVVAVDAQGGIGAQGGLPWPRLRGDLKFFRALTQTAPEGLRNAIIMGRRTWESTEIACRPLPKRDNIVVSRTLAGTPPSNVRFADSLATALELAAPNPGVFVIGGAALYREALRHPALRYVYVTQVEATFACDTHLPELNTGFVETAWDDALAGEEHGIAYRIKRLRRAS